MYTYFTSVLQAGWVENKQYWQLTILHGHDMVTCSCKVFLVSFTSQFLLVQETDLKRHDAKWSFREQEIGKRYLVIQKKKSSKLTFSASQKFVSPSLMSSTKRAFEKIRIDGKNFAIICQVKPKSDPKKEKYSVISFQLYLFVCSRLRISFSFGFCYRLSIALLIPSSRKTINIFFSGQLMLNWFTEIRFLPAIINSSVTESVV